jgi:uncharacterized Zn finger protein
MSIYRNDFDSNEEYTTAVYNAAGITETRTSDGRDAFQVPSSDGSKNYTVSYRGYRGGGDFVNTWECDCPAGQHGRNCKHVKLVVNTTNLICDELGL